MNDEVDSPFGEEPWAINQAEVFRRLMWDGGKMLTLITFLDEIEGVDLNSRLVIPLVEYSMC